MLYKLFFRMRWYLYCLFITLSIVWSSVANYYYFIQQSNKCIGALITGAALLVFGLVVRLLDLYLEKKVAKLYKINNIISGAISMLSPAITKTFINNIVKRKSTKAIAIGILTLISIYCLIVKKGTIKVLPFK